jgi:hypothetical protein
MFVDRPAGRHGQHGDERRQQDQGKADAVQAHEVLDVERRDPVIGKDVLHAFDGHVELAYTAGRQRHPQRGQKDGNRDPQREVAHGIAAVARKKRQDQRPDRWEKNDERHVRVFHSLRSPASHPSGPTSNSRRN